MSNDILGVEITTKRIKLVQVSKGRASAFFSAPVPDDCIRDSLIVAWDALEEILKNAVKEGHFSTKKAAVVIPDAACYVRRMVLPAMSESQLKVNMPYEFKDVIQDDKEHYTFDYSMIGMKYGEGDAQEPKEMELLGAAISKDMLEHYQTLFAHAGLKLVKAAPRIIALQELMPA
jgi:type IV pilus assembly protein PilM